MAASCGRVAFMTTLVYPSFTHPHIRTFANSHIQTCTAHTPPAEPELHMCLVVCLGGGPLVGGGRPVQTGASADQKTSSSSESLRVDSAAPCRRPSNMVWSTWRVQHGVSNMVWSRGSRFLLLDGDGPHARWGEREAARSNCTTYG